MEAEKIVQICTGTQTTFDEDDNIEFVFYGLTNYGKIFAYYPDEDGLFKWNEVPLPNFNK